MPLAFLGSLILAFYKMGFGIFFYYFFTRWRKGEVTIHCYLLIRSF